MRYICLVAIVLALPLNASAQQRRAAGRSDTNQAEQRRGERSGERRSDDRKSDGQRSDGHRPGAKPPVSATPLPWWERQPTPWWENANRILQVGKPATSRARCSIDSTSSSSAPSNDATANCHRRAAIADRAITRRQWSTCCRPTAIFQSRFRRPRSSSRPRRASRAVTPEPYEPPPPPMGALRLEVEPKESLQIFVDGVYIGTPADLGDEIEIAPGTRRIELRARGHRTLTFSAEIVDGRSITYRGSLESVAATAPRTDAPPAARRTRRTCRQQSDVCDSRAAISATCRRRTSRCRPDATSAS